MTKKQFCTYLCSLQGDVARHFQSEEACGGPACYGSAPRLASKGYEGSVRDFVL